MSLAAIISIVGLAALTTAGTLTLSLLLNSAHKQTRAASDLCNEWRRKHDEVSGELELAKATLKVKDDEIVVLRQRLEVAERQRNAAYEEARNQFVERLQKAKIADAAKLVSDLLSTPIRGVSLPRSEDAKDGLLNPFGDKP